MVTDHDVPEWLLAQQATSPRAKEAWRWPTEPRFSKIQDTLSKGGRKELLVSRLPIAPRCLTCPSEIQERVENEPITKLGLET